MCICVTFMLDQAKWIECMRHVFYLVCVCVCACVCAHVCWRASVLARMCERVCVRAQADTEFEFYN